MKGKIRLNDYFALLRITHINFAKLKQNKLIFETRRFYKVTCFSAGLFNLC